MRANSAGGSATGTTGGRINEGTGLNVTRLLSGPLGGDAQLGAMIAEGRLEEMVGPLDGLHGLLVGTD